MAPRDFDMVFEKLVQQQSEGLVISNTGLFNNRAAQLGALSAIHKVAAIFQSRAFVSSGGLMSYGVSAAEGRIVYTYLARILKGERPADLPVQQPTKIELVINLKTAKTLGLMFPLTLLGRADEVIE